MHDYRSYQDNLSLACALFSRAVQEMSLTPDQALGYCVDEIEPARSRDELTRVLLHTAIMRSGIRFGISPLSDGDPFSVDLRDDLGACLGGLMRERLASLGAYPSDIDTVLADVALISRLLELPWPMSASGR